MPDIHVDNLSFTYPGSMNPALRSIRLTIRAGEFVLVCGSSGCGKSTLGLALSGLIPGRIPGRQQGAVYVDGRDLSRMDIHEVAQQIGMVFQNPDNQLIHLDVESEVAFGPENLGLPTAEIRQRLDESLRYTGVEHLRHEAIFPLSGGQKQRVAISATLAMRPKILILDEPTSDLDPVGTQEVLRVLHRLNEKHGMTIVLVEHKIDDVIQWVDRVLLMDEGKIVLDSPARQAFQSTLQWDTVGVTVPDVVRIAKALPHVFGSYTPLSVGEAADGLKNTAYAVALRTSFPSVPSSSTGKLQSDPVLVWNDVNLAYENKQVLNGVNLHIAPNEWVAMVGANGSGKTSMAGLAMGFQAPTGGEVRCFGKPVVTGNVSAQARQIAYLFQAADNMLFTATVEKEFAFSAKHCRADRSGKNTGTVQQLMRLVDLLEWRAANPFHLSHGQRKRLAIGALLAANPAVMILDEPTTGQDEGHAQAFLDFLQSLRATLGLTYLMISHDMRAVANYATRMVVLRDGEVALNGAPREVFAHTEELLACGVTPPPVAHLHSLLTGGSAKSVCLHVSDFVRRIHSTVGVGS